MESLEKPKTANENTREKHRKLMEIKHGRAWCTFDSLSIGLAYANYFWHNSKVKVSDGVWDNITFDSVRGPYPQKSRRKLMEINGVLETQKKKAKQQQIRKLLGMKGIH